LRFGEFLESEQQKVLHLQVVKGGEWTGLIKVYQVLQKNGNISEGQYILLSVERLLMINQMMDISKLIQSTVTPYLLLIACEDNQHLEEEIRDVIRTLFYTMKLKPNIKIIFIIPLGGSIFAFLQNLGKKLFGNGFVRGTEPLTWSDLTNSAQEKLLEKSVKFQGAKVSLNKLMSAESPAAKFLSLGDLLEENKLKIAYPVPVANAYNEGYYIGRIFCHQNAIKQEIFNDIHVTDSRVYLASSEQEYKQLCQLNPKSSVHWLEKDKTGNILWQQSQGSLDTVRRYIDTDRSHTFTDGDLVELLEKAEQQRLMLISDTAGMGKSTVLTHLSKEIKRTFPAKWVVRIDLNDHTDVLKVLKQGQIDKEKAIEFVSEKMLKLKPGLEMELFKHCCEKKQKVGIVIMLDGFDEISPFYKEIVFDLLQALRQTAVEELWVTTRPHLRQELEDKLVQLSFTLQPFSEKNKIEFLTKFWSLKDWFTEMNNEKEEERRERLRNYADELLKKLARSVADKGRELTGIPLQCRMLAEAFDKEVRTFCQSSESKPELQFQLDLFWLYGRFIERKYDIFQEEKLQVRVSNVAGIGQREHHLKSITDDYQLLALKVLFTEEQVALFKNNSECTFLVEELTRTGIVQVNCDGNLHFIHRTFAEYYVADCMVNCLNKGCKTSQQVQTFILKDIFMKRDYSVIRVFIDGLLSSKKPSEEMLKQYGYRIDELKNDCLLHMVALEGNANIIGFLLDSARAGGHKYTARSLLTKQDRRKRTAWFIAAQWGKVESLQRIWDWAKDNLTTEEKKVEFLLATDSDGNIAWHRATEIGAIDVLQKIWELAIDSLTTEEIKSTLLFSTDSRGNTVLQLAARRGKLEVLQKVWEWVKDSLKTEEIESKLLLNTDRCGNTAWHLAAKWGGLQVMQKIWDLAKENLTTEEIQNKMLLAKDIRGNTAWHMAALWGKPGVLQKICEWAKESLTTEDIKDKLLLATDIEGNTAWQLASKGGKIDLLRKINDLAKDCLTTEQINSMLLVPTDRD
jgi:ankyrin repeat protein